MKILNSELSGSKCPHCGQTLSKLESCLHNDEDRAYSDFYETVDNPKRCVSGYFAICRDCMEVFFVSNEQDIRNCKNCKHYKPSSFNHLCVFQQKYISSPYYRCGFIDKDIPEIPKDANCAICKHRYYTGIRPDNSCAVHTDVESIFGGQCILNEDKDNVTRRQFFEEYQENQIGECIKPCPMYEADYWNYLKYRENVSKEMNLFDDSIHIEEFDERNRLSEYIRNTTISFTHFDGSMVNQYHLYTYIRLKETWAGTVAYVTIPCDGYDDDLSTIVYGKYESIEDFMTRELSNQYDAKLHKKIKEHICRHWVSEIVKRFEPINSYSPITFDTNLIDCDVHGDNLSCELQLFFFKDDLNGKSYICKLKDGSTLIGITPLDEISMNTSEQDDTYCTTNTEGKSVLKPDNRLYDKVKQTFRRMTSDQLYDLDKSGVITITAQ